VTSFELLMFITRRAIAARVARLAGATTTNDSTMVAAAVRIEGDQATTPPMVAVTSDRPALPATTSDQPATRTADRATTSTRQGTSARTPGATYWKVRELYRGGMTIAAQIAREVGVSSSYAQRTLRQVKNDLAREATKSPDGRATTDQRADQTTRDRQPATRSHDDQATTTGRDDEATTRATTNGDGRTTTDGDRHLSLIRDQEADRGEVPSR